MYTFKTPTRSGDLETVAAFTPDEFDLGTLRFADTITKRGKHKRNYLNIVSAFDIETTTLIHSEYSEKPLSYMYHWQWALEDKVVFGRTWNEFIVFIEYLRENLELSENKNLVVYCHFLSFEFMHMQDFITPVEVFARDKYKAIYVRTEEGIEFRCSYFLTNMSLEAMCSQSKSCIHIKAKNIENYPTYDYSIIRTPATPLEEHELAYCYNDVRGLVEALHDYLEDDTLTTIPMTSTGFVRRDIRELMAKNKFNYKLIQMTALDSHLYDLCKRAFRGGDTHANRYKTGVIQYDMESQDMESAYPAILASKKFPMSKFRKTTDEMTDHNFAYLAVVRFTNIVCKQTSPSAYISYSKCELDPDDDRKSYASRTIQDNGRILYAPYVNLVITDLDYEIIKADYEWESITFIEIYKSYYDYLPAELIDGLKVYLDGKCSLKNVPGMEYYYMKSKNKFNSGYGLMVTDLLQDIIDYVDGEWYSHQPDDLEAELQSHYRSRKTFLAYQWGVWTTAHCRYRLHEGRSIVGNDAVYWDTDSVKFLNPDKYRAAFAELATRYRAENLNSPHPLTSTYADGTQCVIGGYDNDGNYKRFKTLGAKKYFYESDDGYHLTVSGMSKTRGRDAILSRAAVAGRDPFDYFDIGYTYENIGRTTSYYNHSPIRTITVTDYRGIPCTFITASNIATVDATYTLGVTDEYYTLILNNLNLLLTDETGCGIIKMEGGNQLMITRTLTLSYTYGIVIDGHVQKTIELEKAPNKTETRALEKEHGGKLCLLDEKQETYAMTLDEFKAHARPLREIQDEIRAEKEQKKKER